MGYGGPSLWRTGIAVLISHHKNDDVTAADRRTGPAVNIYYLRTRKCKQAPAALLLQGPFINFIYIDSVSRSRVVR